MATFTSTAIPTLTATKIPLIAPSVTVAEAGNGSRNLIQLFSNPNPTPLDKPTGLTLVGLRLCWDAVPNADDYVISPNTVTLVTPPTPEGNNRLCSQLLGVRVDYVLRLIALSYDNPNFTNSGWSDDSVTVDEIPSLILPTPANLKCKYHHVCWEEVENAESYSFNPNDRQRGFRDTIPTPTIPGFCHCNPTGDTEIFCHHTPWDVNQGDLLRVRAIADPPFQISGYSDPLVVDALCDSDPG